MKPLYIAAIIAFIIIFAGYYSHSILESDSDMLYDQLTALENNLYEKDDAKAQENFKDFNEEWGTVYNEWSVLIEHFEIDNINLGLQRLKSFILAQQYGDALAEVQSLKLLIKHIPEKESLKLNNIF